MIVFGLRTCDTCRKALKALEAGGYDIRFHDVRAAPLSADEIARFHAAFGSKLLNRASATWRALSEAERAGDEKALLAAHPTLMKRPLIAHRDRLHLGWGPEVQAALLS